MNSYLETHLSLARASNLPTTWSNVLCACLLAGSLNWLPFLSAILAVSLFYTGGMYLNDWRDAEYDRGHQSYRPIPSKRISRLTVLICAILYFAAALGISYALKPMSVPWALGLLACVVIYDFDHKDNAFSPLLMAGCRALIYPWAAVLTGQGFTIELWLATAAAFAYTLGLTCIARGKLGFKQKLLFSLVVLAPVFIWLSYTGGQWKPLGLTASLVLTLWILYSLSGIFRRSQRIGFTVGNLIAGFCLVDLLAAGTVSPVAPMVVPVFALLFIGTLKFQTLISGT